MLERMGVESVNDFKGRKQSSHKPRSGTSVKKTYHNVGGENALKLP